MNTTEVHITQPDLRKLLATASADAALLYLYLQGGNAPEMAAEKLNISQSRVSCALATLRQLDLYGQEKTLVAPMQRPEYSEQDILCAMDTDRDFRALYGEIQRLLGRPLNTEEMKIILGREKIEVGINADATMEDYTGNWLATLVEMAGMQADATEMGLKINVQNGKAMISEGEGEAAEAVAQVEEGVLYITNEGEEGAMPLRMLVDGRMIMTDDMGNGVMMTIYFEKIK